MRQKVCTLYARWLRMCVAAAFCIAAQGLYAKAADLREVPAQGPIAFPIPQANGSVWIEIGDVDVTAFARIEDGSVIVSGFAPLSAGRHAVTVYLARDDSFEVIAEFSVSVSGRARVSHAGSLSLAADGGDSETRVEASIAGEVTVQSGDGSFTGTATYLGSTDPGLRPDGRALDLRDYLLTYQRPMGRGVFTARVGHHAVSPGTLLVDDRTRRGLSFGLETIGGRFAFDVFTMRASDVLGAADLLGVNTPEDRISGLRFAVRPSATADLTLTFEAYEGRGATYFANTVGQGSGIAVSLEGSARAGALRYGLSAARTGWDDDGDTLTSGTLHANAVAGYVAYDLQPSEQGAQITLGAEFALTD